MNKKAAVIIFLLIVSTILVYAYMIKSNVDTYKYLTRYGHFEVGGKLKYPHVSSDAIQLEDGRILILGTDLSSKKEETEIYDPKTDIATIYKFPENIKIDGNGLALKDNKIFLLKVCDTNSSKCDSYPDYETNFAVYDLGTKEVKVFNKFPIPSSNLFIKDYFVLNDGRVFIFSALSKYFNIFVYNPKINVLDVHTHPNNSIGSKAIQINDNEVLILRSNSGINKYNIQTKRLETLKSKVSLRECLFTKVGDKILITGRADFNPKDRKYYNELYDIKTDSIEKIPPMSDEKRKYSHYGELKIPTSYRVLPINQDFVLIVGGDKHNWGSEPLSKNTAEIYDIKKKEFIRIKNMHYAHSYFNIIRLNDEEVLLIGGKVYPVKEKQFFIPLERNRIEKFIIKKGLQNDINP